MATWAYECRPCKGSGVWMVARELVDALPAEVFILRVKSGTEWHCATVKRDRPVAVEAMLLRAAEASDALDCPDCAAPPESDRELAPASQRAASAHIAASAQVEAAAISIQGQRLLIVLVPLALVSSAGEADMRIADLRARFDNIDVLLMGQEDDGSPHYHGHPILVELVSDLPIDKMPWKTYPLA